MIYFKVFALNIVTVLIMPLILVQGLWVRKKTQVLPEPRGERVFAAFKNIKATSNRVLVVGDSAAAGVGADTQHRALSGLLYAGLSKHSPTHVSLHAKTGYKSEDVIALLHGLPAESFASALVSIGVNDVTKFVSIARWRKNIEIVHKLLTQKFGCQRIVFTALPPIHSFPALPQPLRALLGLRALLLNQVLEQCVVNWANTEVLYVPALEVTGSVQGVQQSGLMAEDGFHPSAEGYQLWAQHALERLKR